MAKKDKTTVSPERRIAFNDAFARLYEVAGCRTQCELAKFLDVRQSSISDAKRRCSIPGDWLIKAWHKTSVSPDWIMQGDLCGHMLAVPSNQAGSPVATDAALIRREITSDVISRVMAALGVEAVQVVDA